jgi:hypothetical protein
VGPIILGGSRIDKVDGTATTTVGLDGDNLGDTGPKKMAIPVTPVEAPAMRKLRLRFREFLLLVTLASLITAALTIRARTADQKYAPPHPAMRAHQVRQSYIHNIEFTKRWMEMCPQISETWAAGCDVRIMPFSVTDGRDFPTERKSLLIWADSFGTLWFRMSDGEGKIFDGEVKIAVERMEGSHRGFDGFHKVLEGLWPPHELTAAEKRWIIDSVTPFVNDYRTDLAARLKALEAGYAEALAKAEEYERPARRP